MIHEYTKLVLELRAGVRGGCEVKYKLNVVHEESSSKKALLKSAIGFGYGFKVIPSDSIVDEDGQITYPNAIDQPVLRWDDFFSV